MKGHLVMSRKERRKQVILAGVKEGRVDLKTAAVQLEISYRQCRRSYQRYLLEGDAGLIHQSRQRASNRKKAESFKQEVLAYYQEKLMGFGPTFATEKLATAGYTLDHDTLRLWLCRENLWVARRQRAPYRHQRERRQRFGELVQMDGSHHQWFGIEKSCLMNMVDDATTHTLARLYPEETTEGAMRTLWRWIELYGIPQALYVDRKTVYVTEREATLEEALAGAVPLTAFGKACYQLGIELIKAWSPQAKGRVERSHAVYQDRFVKELKWRHIQTLTEANEILESGFCDELNQRFACKPASTEDAHRPLSAEYPLTEIFCINETRVLRNDWTFSYQARCYQVLKPVGTLKPKEKITIRTRLDQTQSFLYQNQFLAVIHLEQRPKAMTKIENKSSAFPVFPKPMTHPWKQLSFQRAQLNKLKKTLAAGQGF